MKKRKIEEQLDEIKKRIEYISSNLEKEISLNIITIPTVAVLLVLSSFVFLKDNIVNSIAEVLSQRTIIYREYSYNLSYIPSKLVEFCKYKNKDANVWIAEVFVWTGDNVPKVKCFLGKGEWSATKDYSLKEFEEWLNG